MYILSLQEKHVKSGGRGGRGGRSGGIGGRGGRGDRSGGRGVHVRSLQLYYESNICLKNIFYDFWCNYPLPFPP